MKGKLIKPEGELDKSTVIVRDFETPLLVSDRANRWPISKDIENLDYTINQLDLTGTQSTLNQQQNTPFSSVHGILAKIVFILGY